MRLDARPVLSRSESFRAPKSPVNIDCRFRVCGQLTYARIDASMPFNVEF